MGNAKRKFPLGKWEKWIFFFCLILFILQIFSILIREHESFFAPGYNETYKNFKAAYDSSQYTTKINPGIIPDQTLESFAGGAFLKGTNPIHIIHDQPPLGRYITAFSIFLFDNSATLAVVLLLISIVGIFLIANHILNNRLLALIPLGIFINQSFFLSKFTYLPLLEPMQLPFIVFAIYFFMRFIDAKHFKKWALLTVFCIGFIISIRFFILGLVIFSVMCFYTLFIARNIKKTLTLLLYSPLSLIILVLSYTKTILDGYSILQVFGIQKYILAYHQSKFILPFSVWDLLLFNRWHTWWGSRSISFDPEWNILWPVSVILAVCLILFSFKKNIVLSSGEKILGIWIFSYCLMLSAGYTSTRYFLPLIPFLYILATAFVVKIINKNKNHT